MTPNIASPVFNTLVLAFFVVILIGIALLAYAATQLKKAQQRAEACAPAPASVATVDTTVED
jgi:threonine/homoserine/homoserine lactone efflux protein